MKQEIPWNRYIVEAFVIVGSILLAFGIDALWQGYNERKLELATISNLEREFAANLDRITRNSAGQSSSEETILHLLEDWSELEPSIEIEQSLIIALTVQGTLNLATGAFESYLSGDGEQIQNQELRNLLHSWPGLVDNYIQNQDIDTRFVQETSRQYMSEMTDYGRLMAVHPFGVFTDLPVSELDNDGLMKILDDPLAKSYVARRYSNLNVIRRISEGVLTRVSEDILSMLRAELEKQ